MDKFYKLIFTITLLICTLNVSAKVDYTVRHISTSEGLVHLDVNCITQDASGLIWLGTNAGLQSFDGYDLKFYDYYSNDADVYESHNRVNSISCKQNIMWIGTDSGLVAMDLDINRYFSVKFVNDNSRIAYSYIKTVKCVGNYIFVNGWTGQSIARYDVERNLFYFLDWKSLAKDEYVSDFVQCEDRFYLISQSALYLANIDDREVVCEKIFDFSEPITSSLLKNGELYCKSVDNIFKINLSKGDKETEVEMIDVKKITNQPNLLTTNCFFVYDDGSLLIKSSRGLLKIDPISNSAEAVCAVKNEEFNYKIFHIYDDKSGNIFIGSSNGLYIFSKRQRQFESYQYKNVISVDKSSKGELFILDGTTIYCHNKQGDVYREIDLLEYGIKACNVIRVDDAGENIYIGGQGVTSGFVVYNLNRNTASFIGNDIVDSNNISSLRFDRFGILWVGSWDKGVFCVECDGENYKLIDYLSVDTQKRVLSVSIVDIINSEYGDDLYICTDRGLDRVFVDEKGIANRIVKYCVDTQNKHSLSSDFISSLDQQNDSVAWIGTIGGGLNRLTMHKPIADNNYTSVRYTRKNGFITNDPEIVMVDRDQNVWIGSNALIKFDTKSGFLSTLDNMDGLSSIAYKIGAGLKCNDGMFYMGGVGGVDGFIPEEVEFKRDSLNLYFTDMYVHSERVKARDEDGILNKSINFTDKIELKYSENLFTIAFSALDYSSSNRVVYRCRLNSFDSEWRYLSRGENSVTYSSVPYGDYKFVVELSSDNGYTWSSRREVNLAVTPPWWLTTIVKIVIGVVIIAFVFLLIYLYLNDIELNQKNQLNSMKLKSEQEKHNMRIGFLMNISHELKTPLTLIQLAAEKMRSDKAYRGESTIISNATKIKQLISELLDLRRSEMGINKLNAKNSNFDLILKNVVGNLVSWADEKRIELSCELADNVLSSVMVDEYKIETILNNIISNSIKYTDFGGSIKIKTDIKRADQVKPRFEDLNVQGKIRDDIEYIVVNILDDGDGMSSDVLSQIFIASFYGKRAKGEQERQEGTGIGLTIVKAFVKLHSGAIIVSSKEGEGSENIVMLPYLRGEDMVSKEICVDLDIVNYNVRSEGIASEVEDCTEKDKILIVEDNRELNRLICQCFETRYQVFSAFNGVEGLEICRQEFPDIVISDIKMPLMDGVEMCRSIRNDLTIAYIPIILLTAKSNIDTEIECYESGADFYIPKPFSLKLLTINVERLISKREQLSTPNESTVKVDKSDKLHFEQCDQLISQKSRFKEQFDLYIMENMHDSDLSIDMICKHLAIGRTLLYKRVKEECGISSLSEYIRDTRLENAANLLSNSDMNISEILFSCGFNNPSHFSKVFRNKYGVSPKNYSKL